MNDDDLIIGEDTPPPKRRNTKEQYVVVSRAGVPGRVTLGVLLTIIGILAAATGLGLTPWATRIALQELKDTNVKEHNDFSLINVRIETTLKTMADQQSEMKEDLKVIKRKIIR